MSTVKHPASSSLNEVEEQLRKQIKEDMQEIALQERRLLSEMVESQFSRWDALQRQAAKEQAQILQNLIDHQKMGPGKGVCSHPVAKPKGADDTAVHTDIDGSEVPCPEQISQATSIAGEIEAVLAEASVRAKQSQAAKASVHIWKEPSRGSDEGEEEEEEDEEGAFAQIIKKGRDGLNSTEVEFVGQHNGKSTQQVHVGWMNVHAEVPYEHEPKSLLRLIRQLTIEIYAMTRGRRSFQNPMLVRFIDWLLCVQEPAREGHLSRFVHGNVFSWICSLVIVLNAWYVIYEANFEITNLGTRPTRFMRIMEIIFVGFYALEVLLKLIVHRAYFFWNEHATWNIFDLLLVMVSSVEIVLTFMMWQGDQKQDAMVNFQFMRAYRLLKISKIVRILKVVHFFSDIALMLHCILASLETLVGCLIMICFFLYFFSLFFVQAMTSYLQEQGQNLGAEEKGQILSFFGSAQDAALTLFQSTTGGVDWKDIYMLLQPVGWLTSAVFIFYIAFFVVVAWNVITSTFMEKAARIAQPDIDALMLEKHHQDMMDAKQLSEVFSHLDADQSGNISIQEFMDMTTDPAFLEFMQVRGIDIKDAKMFFNMLVSACRGSEVDVKTFIGSCLRMKGLATSIDLHTLGFEVKTIHKRLTKFQDEERQKMARVEQLMAIAIEKIITMDRLSRNSLKAQ